MKKTIISMAVIFSIIFSGLTSLVSAQSRQNNESVKSETVGYSEYYNNDNIRYKSKSTRTEKVYPYEASINGDPQIKGGLKTEPNSDEEDVTVGQIKTENGGKAIHVETMSASWVLYLVTLPERDKFGQIIKVRRKKNTKKIIAIINCGNWSREVGADYKPEDCPEVLPPCVPKEVPDIRESSWTDPETGKTFPSRIYDYGCGKVETEILKEVKADTVCDETLFRNIITVGNRTGNIMNNSEFTVEQALRERFRERAEEFIRELELLEAGITTTKIRFLDIWQQGCVVAGKASIVFTALGADEPVVKVKKKRNWLKKIFIISAIVIAALIGTYFIYKALKGKEGVKTTIRPPYQPPELE